MVSNTQNNSTEDVVKTVTSFRNAEELQTFYRFVNDNGLRREANMLLSQVLAKIAPKKRRGRGRAKKILQ